MFPITSSGIVRSTILFVSLIGFLAAVPAQAADPAVLCSTAKQKAAAKKLGDKVKCHGTALKKGEPVSAECLAKAETKFEDSFSKAEAKGGCATTGDTAAVETLIDDTLAALLAALPTSAPSVCEGLHPADCDPCLLCSFDVGGDCEDQLAACDANVACGNFALCYTGCTSDACRDACQGNAAGAALYFAAIQCAAAACDSPCPAVCGDDVCAAGESSSNCSVDCGCAPICGDGTCESACEDSASCISDCPIPAVCGNNVVEGAEECDGGAGPCLPGYQCVTCQCSVPPPPEWTCAPNYYATGDGCDCGCGAFDLDCVDATLASCNYCSNPGSCSIDSCPGTIDPTNNQQCTP